MPAGPKPLPQTLHEHLGHYVYGLVDPRDGTLFYVGKGQGDRVLQHEWDALGTGSTGPKLDLIREIQSAGHEVRKVILRRGLTESSAFEIEAAIIDAVSHFGASLKTLVRGKGTEFGLRSLEALRLEFNAKPLEIDRPTIIVGINNTWFEDIKPHDLWKMSRSWWRCKPEERKPRPLLLLAVAQQIVRGAWTLDPSSLGRWDRPDWDALPAAKKRFFYKDDRAKFEANRFEGWRFDGKPAADADRYLGATFKFAPRSAFQYLPPVP